MKLSSQQYAQALYDAVSETDPKSHDVLLDRFVKVLAQNGDLNKYPEIEKAYKMLEMRARGIKEAHVTVAREMEFNKGLMDDLNRIVGASFSRPQSAEDKKTGKQVRHVKLEINESIDEQLIGGVVVRVDETLIDASIKGQLDNLNKELIS